MRKITHCDSRLHYAVLAAAGSCLPKRRGLRTVTKNVARAFGANRVIVRHEAGFEFYVHLDDPYWTPMLFDWAYEPEIEQVLRRRLKSDSVFLDCDANIGFWSCFAATIAGEVVAIEAAAQTYAKLVENAELNGSIRPLRKAVSNVSGETVEFAFAEEFHGAAHIVGDSQPAGHIPRDRGGVIETVQTVALDDVSDASGAIIKLDVEGAEIAAVSGARGLLDRGAIVIYEDHGSDPTCETTQKLLDLGLSIEDVAGNPLDLARMREIKKKPGRGYNFVAHA